MTSNCCFVVGLHSVCYQNDCKLVEKHSECLIMRWFPAFGTDDFIFVGEFVDIASRAFSLCKSKHILAILLKCWFCLNPGFNSDGIIFIMYFLIPKYDKCIECLQSQDCLCQNPHTVASVLGHDTSVLAEKPQCISELHLEIWILFYKDAANFLHWHAFHQGP